MGKFKMPERMPTVNKTIRFPHNVIDDVESAIQNKYCTFTAFVLEAVKAALESLDAEKRQ